MPSPTQRPVIAPAVQSGDPRLALEAIRARLAYTIDRTDSARELSALVRRLTDVIGQLAELDKQAAAPDPFDELLAWSGGKF